ncbi:MAG: hypothetical protein LAT67_09900 [Balneolales bacterium]|nr:hypothetical protein [Balneolales bacterium]
MIHRMLVLYPVFFILSAFFFFPLKASLFANTTKDAGDRFVRAGLYFAKSEITPDANQTQLIQQIKDASTSWQPALIAGPRAVLTSFTQDERFGQTAFYLNTASPFLFDRYTTAAANQEALILEALADPALPPLSGFIPIKHSQISDAEMDRAFAVLRQNILNIRSQLSFYFIHSTSRSGPEGYQLILDDRLHDLVVPAIENVASPHFILPPFPDENPLQWLREELSRILNVYQQTATVLISSDQISRISDPQMRDELFLLLESFQNPAHPAVALTPGSLPKDLLPIQTVLIIVMWLIFSISFRFNPTYRKSVFRYFTSYSFMSEDIMESRILLGSSSIVVLLFSSIAWVAVSYSVLIQLPDAVQFDMIRHHLGITEMASFTLLLRIFSITVGLKLLLICWVAALCYRNDILSQAAFFVLWPTHLYLILSTAIVGLIAGGYTITPIVLVLLMLGIALAGFFSATFSFSNNPSLSPWIHHLLGSMLFIVVLLAGLYVLVFSFGLPAFLQLLSELNTE